VTLKINPQFKSPYPQSYFTKPSKNDTEASANSFSTKKSEQRLCRLRLLVSAISGSMVRNWSPSVGLLSFVFRLENAIVNFIG